MTNLLYYKSPFNLASWSAGLRTRILPSSHTIREGTTGAGSCRSSRGWYILILLWKSSLGALAIVFITEFRGGENYELRYGENCTFAGLISDMFLSDTDFTTCFAFRLSEEGFLLCLCLDVIPYTSYFGEDISRRVPRNSSGFRTSFINVRFARSYNCFSFFSRLLSFSSDFARLSFSRIAEF